MNNRAAELQKNRNQPTRSGVSKEGNRGESTFDFMDSRPENVTQRNHQEMADSSPQIRSLKNFQEMANGSRQSTHAAVLQARVDNYISRPAENRNDEERPVPTARHKFRNDSLGSFSIGKKSPSNPSGPIQLTSFEHGTNAGRTSAPDSCCFTEPGGLGKSVRITGEMNQADFPAASTVIQRQLAIQIIEGGEYQSIVKDISIQGRPPGVLKGEEGSHTTAWVVSTEGVRNAILGKTFQESISEIKRLINVARKMPGYKRLQNQTFEQEENFNKCELDLGTALEAATSAPSVLTLQHLVEAYLTFRNALPLSAVKLGATADGKGEPKWIKILYDWENQDGKVLEEAFLSLIDSDALMGFQDATSGFTDSRLVEDKDAMDVGEEGAQPRFKMEKRRTFLDAPGVTKKDKDSDGVKEDVIRQHLLSVASAFPQAYEKSNLEKLGIKKVRNKILRYDELHKKQKEEKKSFPYKAKNKPPSKPCTAVQIDMGPDFDELLDFSTRMIKSIKVVGRPRGVFGSGEKSHTTAWSVIEQGPKTACQGKNLPDAFNAMRTLCQEAFSLPQVEMEGALPEKQRNEFVQAWKILNAELNESSAFLNVESLQRIISYYLGFKNLLPFSAVDLGKKADSHGEPAKLDILRSYASNSKEDIQKAIWGLLDREAMVDIGIGAGFFQEQIKSKEEVRQELVNRATEEQSKLGRVHTRRSVGFIDIPKLADVQPEYRNVFESPERIHKRLPGVPHPSEYVGGQADSHRGTRVGMVVGNHLKNIKISFPEAFEKAEITLGNIQDYMAYKITGDKPGYNVVAAEAAKTVNGFL